MFIPKTPILGRLENSSGSWIRTNGLRVMKDLLILIMGRLPGRLEFPAREVRQLA
jgi:hypothetical protein